MSFRYGKLNFKKMFVLFGDGLFGYALHLIW